MVKTKVQTQRYIDNGDNTITDTKTGLQWIKDSDALGGKFTGYMTFKEAIEACKKLNYGKHKDWRLPAREELLTTVDLKKYNPTIDPIFKCKSSWYWTSTPCAGGSGFAWYVSFYCGDVFFYSKGSSSVVRAVRSSQ